ncbi:hypothetical protein F2P79_024577 [Pimephales promelas]|nr:hypothetical protein F2P79_024577 [Pimephales promelas]
MPPKTRQDRGAGTDEQLGMDQEPPSSTELQATASPVEGSVSELASLVKVLLQSQATRDDRMEQVLAKQDQRWRNMQHQFQQIQHQVIQIQAGGDHRGSQAALTVTSPEPTGEGMSSGSIEPRLHPLTRDDDIEQFLTTFERMATACRWPQANWAIRLVPLLTGKARGAYVAMDGNDAEDYKKVKEAILMKYQINAEIYRQRFRSSEILPDENPRELYVRLKDLFSKWVKPERCTIQQLSELIILEQFMRMINSDMAVWIKEHDPATAEEAAKLAETYLAARQEAQHSCGARSQKWPSSSQTLVQDSLVSEDEYITQESLKVCCVHGEVREYPIAEIYLTVQGQTFLLHVAVASQLPHEVVLGRDLPILCDLVPKVQPCYAVTRAQSAIADFKEMPFAGVDIEVAVGKRRTSKKERRKRKFEGRGKEQVEELPLPECSLDMTIPEDIAEVQKNDPTLQDWFQKVSVVDGVRKKVGSCLVDEEYIVKKGILYQVYKLLGIRAIKTTPYHPQTDGLVERFNQTLKSMLRKFVSKSGSDWDQWLPYLLFAYREVPQASTGFSPFELLYGRQVRGPLDLLKEKWEGPKDGMCSVVQYVVQMRERLEEMTSLAQENIRRAQQTQKVCENKWLAKWHGPYEVLRKTGRVTYEISMPEREFHHRKETEAVQLFVRVVGEEDEPTEQYFPTSFAQQAVDLSHLEQPQIDQIKQLVDPRLFQEKPGGVIRPQQEKMEAIRRYQPPTTKKQVRSFLGLVGWYRRFVPNFSARASVLTDLTRSAAPNKVVWTEQGERAFRDLREAVCGDSVLLSPDFQKPFILQTDASGVGLGAVLLQEVDGDRRPVAFLSRKLFPRETRYSTVEQECLAIKWATDSLRYYLLGRPFVLETDHRALQWLERMKDSNARITRWSLSLQPYQFTVKYCPGARNKVADFLSRIPEEVNAKVGSSTWVRGGAEL